MHKYLSIALIMALASCSLGDENDPNFQYRVQCSSYLGTDAYDYFGTSECVDYLKTKERTEAIYAHYTSELSHNKDILPRNTNVISK